MACLPLLAPEPRGRRQAYLFLQTKPRRHYRRRIKGLAVGPSAHVLAIRLSRLLPDSLMLPRYRTVTLIAW